MRPAGGAWFRYGEPLDFARITRSDKLSEATTLAATRERERDVSHWGKANRATAEFLVVLSGRVRFVIGSHYTTHVVRKS